MHKFNILLAVLGTAFLLSACHVPHHHHVPPGHGGVPPGQAKKGGWHTPPGHRRLDERSGPDSAPKLY